MTVCRIGNHAHGTAATGGRKTCGRPTSGPFSYLAHALKEQRQQTKVHTQHGSEPQTERYPAQEVRPAGSAPLLQTRCAPNPAAANPAPVSAAFILNVGKDQVLLKTRSLLLRSAGYDVESSFSIEDAIHRLRTTSIDLVLLCHSIPAEERQGMIRLIRDNAPSTPIVFVS